VANEGPRAPGRVFPASFSSSGCHIRVSCLPLGPLGLVQSRAPLIWNPSLSSGRWQRSILGAAAPGARQPAFGRMAGFQPASLRAGDACPLKQRGRGCSAGLKAPAVAQCAQVTSGGVRLDWVWWGRDWRAGPHPSSAPRAGRRPAHKRAGG
jgi:hypothetical protein